MKTLFLNKLPWLIPETYFLGFWINAFIFAFTSDAVLYYHLMVFVD